MRSISCFWICGVAIPVLGALLLVGDSRAEIGDKKDKIVERAIDTIAAAARGFPLENVMKTLAFRGAGGRGIGNKPNAVLPDGAWLFLKGVARLKPRKILLVKHKADLIEMAWTIRGIAEITVHTVPLGLNGAQTKNWLQSAKAMRISSVALAKAFTTENPEVVQNAAIKITKSCDKCHEEFK